ncbi:hypothetical protein AYK24_01360 [Thermoplasmatales archaeon SG8-52-4]|nr:MAG: hypothetical protein AYK24_01360 [Thermoplasmatales archaeon SG8-52-4]
MKNKIIDTKYKQGVLFFVKYPKLGEVKSRLSVDLDPSITVELYRLFVKDLLQMLNKTSYTIFICFYPSNSLKNFKQWLGNKYNYIPQEGKDLGQRMINCFNNIFAKQFDQVIVIGSDSPDLPKEILDKAFLKLKTHNAVIGPSLDGGYYLLGLNKTSFSINIFKDITWGSDKVFTETKKRFSEEKISNFILPIWGDIDTFNDLKNLYQKNKNKEFASSATMTYLHNRVFQKKDVLK